MDARAPSIGRRIDSAGALPSRGALETRWSRFPSYAALNDSIRDEGGRLEHGPIRFDLTPSGVIGYRMDFARRANGGTAVVWVSVASAKIVSINPGSASEERLISRLLPIPPKELPASKAASAVKNRAKPSK